ncbi:MAG: DUF4199 domain-containing protein [Pseudarcicella sp.]|nr:DUF4199 domain-containing protein [Pseudarcicella sp.]
MINFFRIGVLSGFIAAIFNIIYCLVLNNYFHIIPLGGKKFPALVFNIFFIVLAIYYLKKSNTDGALSFWEGFLMGTFTNFVASCVTASFLYWFASQSDWEIVKQYISAITTEFTKQKSNIILQDGQAYYDNFLKNIPQITPNSIASDEISQKMVLAFIPILMASLYFRRGYIKK